jgi:hypothetical protein
VALQRVLTIGLHAWLGVASATLMGACRSPKSTPTPSAQFGIFYGGQIQERQFIPFELNSAKQRIGFRLLFPTPLPEATEVLWEVSRPGAREPRALPVSKPDRRVTEFGSATLAQGEQRFEQVIALRPGDPLGLWNLRVATHDEVLIDRPFTLYDADERRRARARARPADAGL